MKTSELRKLIREEARKVIAENTNKSTKVNEGIFDTMMKALSQKVKLDGTILAKPEAKAPLQNLEKAVKGMLPKNKLGAQLFRNLNVNVGDAHKHAAQTPKAVNLNDLK